MDHPQRRIGSTFLNPSSVRCCFSFDRLLSSISTANTFTRGTDSKCHRKSVESVAATYVSRLSAAAVHKLLRCSEGSLVQFCRAFDQTEAPTELLMQRLSAIPAHVKSAALRRSLRPERAYEHEAPGLHGVNGLRCASGPPGFSDCRTCASIPGTLALVIYDDHECNVETSRRQFGIGGLAVNDAHIRQGLLLH